MRDVDVAAEHDFAATGAQRLEMRRELGEEAVLRGLPFRSGGARRKVHRDRREVLELGLDIAALGVELGRTEAEPHRARLLGGVHRRARVAASLRAVEETMQAVRESERLRDIDLVGLDLLQADDVGLGPAQPAKQSLGGRRADTVDIQGDDAQHGVQSPSQFGFRRHFPCFSPRRCGTIELNQIPSGGGAPSGPSCIAAPAIHRVCVAGRCPALWRVQDQGGTAVAVLLQCGAVQPRCAAGRLARFYAQTLLAARAEGRVAVRHAVRSGLQGHHAGGGHGHGAGGPGHRCSVCLQPQGSQGSRRGRRDRRRTARGARRDRR